MDIKLKVISHLSAVILKSKIDVELLDKQLMQQFFESLSPLEAELLRLYDMEN